MMALEGWQWGVAGLAGLCVGISKAGFNGLGMLTVLLMAQIFPAKASTGVVLPLLIAADVFAVAIFRKHARWNYFPLLLPPACLGVVIGFWLMPRIPDADFGGVIGWIVLFMVGLHYLRRMMPTLLQHLPESRAFAWTMGGAAGVTTMLANAAGPIMNLYLLARGLPKFEFVGTAAVYFLIVNVIKVPFSAALGLIHSGSLYFNLLLLPTVFVGLAAGRWLLHRLPQRVFEEVLVGMALLAALSMVW